MEKLAEIQKFEGLLLNAIKNNDIELLNILLHDDLLFVPVTGVVIIKEIDMANYRSGQIHIEKIAASEQTVRLI